MDVRRVERYLWSIVFERTLGDLLVIVYRMIIKTKRFRHTIGAKAPSLT